MPTTDKDLLIAAFIKIGTVYEQDKDETNGLEFVLTNESSMGAEKFGTAFTFDREGGLLGVESYVLLLEPNAKRKSVQETLRCIGGARALEALPADPDQ